MCAAKVEVGRAQGSGMASTLFAQEAAQPVGMAELLVPSFSVSLGLQPVRQGVGRALFVDLWASVMG